MALQKLDRRFKSVYRLSIPDLSGINRLKSPILRAFLIFSFG
ncbi:hypothetical protein SR187_9035 [Streptococcus ruminantium]|uniref:Uncharacterized protein n=1 Tax=Streptococcus ruminantium TaxID=1917441 RepID=A0A2Z5TQL4_9STRE|nr:hypothetical protein SR187_9035 [Streptococcus ruminantium]